jgi:MFS family permease
MIGIYVDRLRRHISFRQTFTSLRHPNYRLWFWGQLVSLFGTWMQTTAQGFLVYELTRSPAYLGYVGFASGIPTWLFMAYGGVFADRASRRRVLIATQSAMMVLAFVLAALTFLRLVQPWHIVLLAFFLGAANAFDAPARHAFVPDMVPREDLTNAIALNSTIFNSAIAVGPAVAGVTYALVGPAWCFMINGLSFLAVIAALMMMHVNPADRAVSDTSAWQDLKDGFSYVLSQPMIRTLILIVLVTGLFGSSFAVLIPAWAVDILHGNAATNGWLQSARGVGALLGALLIASLGRFSFRGRLLTLGTLAFPAVLLVFALVHWLPLSLLALLASGGALVFTFNIANALVQTLVRDELRGRVMGIYSLTFFGFLPIGALWIGLAAEKLGEPAAIIINSVALLAFSGLLTLLVPQLRRLE